MTDQPPTQPPPPTGAAPGAATGPAAEPARKTSFEERMESFGREAGAGGERWGREAEAAGKRWSKDQNLVGAADTATRLWGLIVLAVGIWFFADVTLGYDMPSVPWRDLWPLVLIAIGLAVVFRGMTRRA